MQPTAGAIKAAQLGLKTVCIDKCLGCENGGLCCAKPEEFFTKLLPRRGPPGGTCLNVRG